MTGTVHNNQKVSTSGVAPTFSAAAAQMEFPNSAVMVLHIKTNATGPVNITVKNQTTTPEGTPNPDRVVNVPVSSERVIGPFPRATYNMGNGNIQVLIDTPANCTVTAYEHQ